MSYSIPSLRPFLTPIKISSGYGVSPSLLMLHGESTPIIDSSSNNWTITNSNVTVSTSPTKFSSAGSMLFNKSSSSNLSIPNSSSFALSTYTIECFIYLNSLTSDMVIYGSQVNQVMIFINSAGNLTLSNGVNTGSSSTTSISTGSWVHIAVVNTSGGSCIGYIDGISSVTYYAGSISMSYGKIASASYNAMYFDGYIDEFRISNSAIYTGNFTPPSAAFA